MMMVMIYMYMTLTCMIDMHTLSDAGMHDD